MDDTRFHKAESIKRMQRDVKSLIANVQSNKSITIGDIDLFTVSILIYAEFKNVILKYLKDKEEELEKEFKEL